MGGGQGFAAAGPWGGGYTHFSVQVEGGKAVLPKNAFALSFWNLNHTQIGERLWAVGLEDKPVTRGPSPRTEEGASPKSAMTRPLKSLGSASILPICHRWTVKMDEERKSESYPLAGTVGGKGGSRKNGDHFDVKETVRAISGWTD